MGLRDSFKLTARTGQRRTGIIVFGTALALGGGAWLALAEPSGPADGKAHAPTQAEGRKGGKDSSKRSPSVAAVTARQGDLAVRLSALGTVTASNTAVVKPRVDGQLLRISFREGQWVKAGDVLAEIDPRPFQIQLDQAHGQLLRDQALLAGAKVDLARYRELLAKDSIARQQVETQEATVRQHEANVVTSRAQEANARLQLGFSRVTAPASGRLGLRQVDAGNSVRATDSNGLVTITQTRPIHVIFAIPAQQLSGLASRLHAGETLAVEALDQDGQTPLAKGRLLSLDNQIDVATGTVKLKAEFGNQDDRLFPNQFVNVRLTVATQHDSVLLPVTAVQRGTAGSYVYVIDAKEPTVSQRPISLGAANGDTVVVSHGLAAGERVVLDGTDKLRPGARVRVVTLDDKPLKARGPVQDEPKPARLAGAPDFAASKSIP